MIRVVSANIAIGLIVRIISLLRTKTGKWIERIQEPLLTYEKLFNKEILQTMIMVAALSGPILFIRGLFFCWETNHGDATELMSAISGNMGKTWGIIVGCSEKPDGYQTVWNILAFESTFVVAVVFQERDSVSADKEGQHLFLQLLATISVF